MPWVFGLVLKWHDNSSYLHSEIHQYFPDRIKFQSWIENFRAQVCVKARNERKRANNSHTQRKTDECFQQTTIGSCSRRDACILLHTHATGDREDNVEWSGDTQEILTQKQAYSSVPKVKYTDWREKLEQSEGQSYDSSWKSLVFGWQDEKDHRVFIDITPCVVVTSLETDAFMAIVACIDELMVRATSARGRK